MSSTNRGGVKRKVNDAYQTPPSAINALLRHVHPTGTLLEPCLGSANITHAVGILPTITLVDWCEITKGRDFLDPKVSLMAEHFDWIITNPPYSLARQFIDRSLALADNVAMLLRLNFYESQERCEWWQTHLPTAQYTLARRPNFLDMQGNKILNKQGKPGTDSCAYAWFVWSRQYSGIYVIDNPEEP